MPQKNLWSKQVDTIIVKSVTGLAWLGGSILSYLFGYAFGVVGLILAGLYIFVLVKIHTYTKNKKLDKKISTIIVWSNLITWFIPIAGILTVVASLGIAEKEKNIKYKIISITGLVLTLVNGGIGTYQSFMQ